MATLPEELEREILKRLPVKSLLRFKCVSKNWHALIKNPSFIKDHLRLTKKKRFQLMLYDWESTRNDPGPITYISDQIVDTPDHLSKFRGMGFVLGSIDGLFLLQRGVRGSDVRFALWNPATREVRPLPELPSELQHGPGYNPFMYGFGLDPLTNDYKVVLIRWMNGSSHVPAGVYSCSRDSWRVLDPLNATYFPPIPGDCVNGIYYWLFRNEIRYHILSFDLSDEVFGVIGMPNVPFSYKTDLTVFDDCVAVVVVVVDEVDEDEVHELWLMIQPGVWNKRLTLQSVSFYYNYGLWDSSTIIFENESCQLMSYDLKTQETRDLGFHNPGLMTHTYIFDRYKVLYYKESLVAIKRENGELNDCSLPDIFDPSLSMEPQLDDM